MNSPETIAGMTIAAVERDTGLGKDTLRIWERRYGFPRPLRDAGGERVGAGLYFARLDVGEGPKRLRKVVVAR